VASSEWKFLFATRSAVIPGAPQSGETGIHNRHREYEFRACALRRIPE